MPDDNWGNRDIGVGYLQRGFAVRGSEPALCKPDPACAELCPMRREHQVLQPSIAQRPTAAEITTSAGAL